MSGFSRVVVMGNLTRDPRVKDVSSGGQVAELGLALDEAMRSKDGEAKDTVCFIDVVVWGRQAVACGEHLAKGAQVLVEGRLQFDRWQSLQRSRRCRESDGRC